MRAICADKTYRIHLRRSMQNENSSSTDAAAETVASLRPPSYRDHTGRRTASYPPEIWCLHLSVRPQIWCLHLSVSTGTWCPHLSLSRFFLGCNNIIPGGVVVLFGEAKWTPFKVPFSVRRLMYPGRLWPGGYRTWTGWLRLRAVTRAVTYPGL